MTPMIDLTLEVRDSLARNRQRKRLRRFFQRLGVHCVTCVRYAAITATVMLFFTVCLASKIAVVLFIAFLLLISWIESK